MTIIYTVNTTSYDNSIIRTKSCDTEFASYHVLTYDLKMKDVREENSIYRSVGICPDSKKLLYFSPPKSINIDRMLEKNPVLYETNIIANQKMEGTMINLFYDYRIGTWEIATKNGVGGNYFYLRNNYDEPIIKGKLGKTNNQGKQSTFRDMFLDACCVERNTPLNAIEFLQHLPKEYCYSLVLQHPENHLVFEIEDPQLYVVAVYRINSEDNEAEFIELNNVYHWECMEFLKKYLFKFPFLESGEENGLKYQMKINNMEDFNNIKNKMDKYPILGNNYFPMGVMFTNVLTGDRSYIMNPLYELLKEIRGNHPNLQYQFFSLYRSNKVKEFLNCFPMYEELFCQFYSQIIKFVKEIHNAYVSYYINKQGKYVQISKNIFKHIYKLHHEFYLNSLNSPKKQIITQHIVCDYFNSMEPKEMLYHITNASV